MQTIAALARQTKKHVAELNLFEDGASRSDPFHLRTAILSTRVYIVLLTVSVITLIVFTLLGTQSEVITILNPSQADYEAFLHKNGTSSSCPCSRVTIPYGNFTLTTVDYHPVCQSVFISDDWINHLFKPNFARIYQGDFRALASNYFQLLATFCSHAKRSVDDALDNFHSQTLLSPDVLLPNSLDSQIEVQKQFLRSSTANSVLQLFQLVRTTTQANVLQTAIPLSTLMFMLSWVSVDVLQQGDISFTNKDLSQCYCVSARNCSVPSHIFDTDRGLAQNIFPPEMMPESLRLANVSGFFFGCFPVESLVQSTLECLFDWSCLKTIFKYIPSSNITGVYALNTSQTRFAPNTSIEIIINELFIERWSMKPSFSDYYAQCAPILCTYTLSKRNNSLYVLTKLLGLYGGLTAALHFCVPLIVAWWRKRRVIAPAESHPSEYRYIKNPRLILLKF
jgi:hypothetical protein